MKAKILLTALLSFLLVFGKASQFTSTLFIDVAEHPTKNYVVVLNHGDAIESTGDLKIKNVRNGNNRIQIFKRTYRATRRNPNAFVDRMVYNGFVKIPRNSKVFTQLFNRNLITNQIVSKRNRVPNNPRGNQFGMRARNFQALKQTVINESFDRNKLQILNSAVRNNVISSRQVKQLMVLMTYDKNRLIFAKKAFANTVDQQNYFLVSSGLTYESNRRRLLKFVNQQPQNNKPRRGGNRRR